MRSKYDRYWAGLLEQLRHAAEFAAFGPTAKVDLPELRSLGDRRSWYGVAEVSGRDLTRATSAHAVSLGRAITASGICSRWTDRTFRFTINSVGSVITITSTGSGQWRSISPTAGQRPMWVARAGEAQTLLQRPSWTKTRRESRSPDGRQLLTAEFYRLLDELAERTGGPRQLRDCTGRQGWPECGVYFFFEDDEVRADGGNRVVRVGTHALNDTDDTMLWTRLRQHRGPLAGRYPGGGNHRASVFRRHVGSALIGRRNYPDEVMSSWLDRDRIPEQRDAREPEIEREVSRCIRAMPFLWLDVPGRPDPITGRGYIERNSIGLLSCLTGGIDQPSSGWLGHDARNSKVRGSGLWNHDHVDDGYDPGFLVTLAQLVRHAR